jgi:hypothetical protein
VLTARPGNDSFAAGSTTVEITLTPDGTGTNLNLVHRGLPEEERQHNGMGTSAVSLFSPPVATPVLTPGPRHDHDMTVDMHTEIVIERPRRVVAAPIMKQAMRRADTKDLSSLCRLPLATG